MAVNLKVLTTDMLLLYTGTYMYLEPGSILMAKYT